MRILFLVFVVLCPLRGAAVELKPMDQFEVTQIECEEPKFFKRRARRDAEKWLDQTLGSVVDMCDDGKGASCAALAEMVRCSSPDLARDYDERACVLGIESRCETNR